MLTQCSPHGTDTHSHTPSLQHSWRLQTAENNSASQMNDVVSFTQGTLWRSICISKGSQMVLFQIIWSSYDTGGLMGIQQPFLQFTWNSKFDQIQQQIDGTTLSCRVITTAAALGMMCWADHDYCFATMFSEFCWFSCMHTRRYLHLDSPVGGCDATRRRSKQCTSKGGEEEDC